jgi:hypothetical protein
VARDRDHPPQLAFGVAHPGGADRVRGRGGHHGARVRGVAGGACAAAHGTGFLNGLVEELEHLPIRTLPGSARRKVVASDTVPVAIVTAAALLVLAPAIVVHPGRWGVRLADLLAVPGVAVAAISASSVAMLSFATLGRRMIASAVLVSVVYVILLGGWSLTAGLGRGPVVLALGAMLASACWSLCGWMLEHRFQVR